MAVDIYSRRAEANHRLSVNFASVTDRYEYPRGLDLHPNSELHRVLLNFIMEKGVAAKTVVDRCAPEWRRMGQNMDAFVPLDEHEALVKENDPRKPVRIVVPQTWALGERLKTSMANIFLRNPIHPMKPGGGMEDYYGALMLERLVQRQSVWFKEALRWMTIWGDAFTYGVGPAEVIWKRKYARRMDEAMVDPILAALRKQAGSRLPEDQEGAIIKYMTDELLYEGQELRPIDVFNYFRDPSVTPNDLQDAEYAGYSYSWNAMDLLSAEQEPGSYYFNGIFVRMMTEAGMGASLLAGDVTANRGQRMGLDQIGNAIKAPHSHRFDQFKIYVKLVPWEWALGESNLPELWEFCVAGDRVITSAQPCNRRHGMIPIIECAPTTNGHDVVPVSYLAATYGIQEYVDFLVNSNVTSIRKNLNAMIAVDPSAFYWEDLLNPGPGMLLRMKPHVGGTGRLDQYIHQFETPDVTGQNIANLQLMMGLMKDTSGITDLMQGNMSNMPERPTAELGTAAANAAFSRLQMIAMIIGQQCFYDVGKMAAYNTQEFMSQPTAVDIAGRYEESLRQIWGGSDVATVSIADINVAFDVIPLDGSAPGTENVGAWTEITKSMLQIPEVAAQIFMGLDATRVFANWARMTGAGNVLDFLTAGGATKMQVQSQPDAQVEAGVQAGNLVPLGARA